MLYELDGRKPLLKGENFVAHNATLIGRITLEPGASVWYGCVLRGDCDEIVVGEGTNVQDSSVLHTDVGVQLRIGKGCTIGHMTMLHGCEIGEGSLIGIKSVILNRAKIGRNCLVGACSLITEGKSFPDGSLIMGSPAKLVRPLLPHEIEMVTTNADFYRQNAQRFIKGLKPA